MEENIQTKFLFNKTNRKTNKHVLYSVAKVPFVSNLFGIFNNRLKKIKKFQKIIKCE